MTSMEDTATSLSTKFEDSPFRERSDSEIADNKFASLLLSMRKTTSCTQEDMQGEDIQFKGKICSIALSNSLIGSRQDLPMDNSFKEINELDESSDSQSVKENPSGVSNKILNIWKTKNQQLQDNKEITSQLSYSQEDSSTTIVISNQEEKIFQWLDSEGIKHVRPEDKMAMYFEERKKKVTQTFRAGLNLGLSTSSHTLNATPIKSSNSLWERRKLGERRIEGTCAPQSCQVLEICQNSKKSLNYFSSSYDL